MIVGTLLFACTLMLDCEKKKSSSIFIGKKGKNMGDRKKTRRGKEEEKRKEGEK